MTLRRLLVHFIVAIIVATIVVWAQSACTNTPPECLPVTDTAVTWRSVPEAVGYTDHGVKDGRVFYHHAASPVVRAAMKRHGVPHFHFEVGCERLEKIK
jgi:hypothetical protein